jgi:HPt (histidine-containing phosphotransfer) domain-containing protein
VTLNGTLDSAVDDVTQGLLSDPRLPPVDVRFLDELEDLAEREGVVNDLLEMFIDDTKRLIDILGEALARGEGEAMGHAAHRIKGSSANLGATELARLCSMLSASDRSSDVPTSEAILLAIRSEFERVQSALDEWLALP